MDSDRRSAKIERLEVVDTGRRRRWSEGEKLKIVLESLQAPRQVAATARRSDGRSRQDYGAIVRAPQAGASAPAGAFAAGAYCLSGPCDLPMLWRHPIAH